MKPVSFKFKIIIGIVLSIVLVGATYYEKYVIHLSSNHQKSQAESSSIENSSSEMGVFQYKGKFLTPVENFKVVTSKFGYRTHPITRTARKFSFWY